MLTETQIMKFQELYRDHFGHDISHEEAIEKGNRLLRLVAAVYHPPNPSSAENQEE